MHSKVSMGYAQILAGHDLWSKLTGLPGLSAAMISQSEEGLFRFTRNVWKLFGHIYTPVLTMSVFFFGLGLLLTALRAFSIPFTIFVIDMYP
jgi:hypothetical protein